MAAGSAAQEDTSTAAPAAGGTSAESLAAWRYFQEVPLPTEDAGASPWWDFVLTASVFDAARPDLWDLRVYDAQSREVPYALRVRSAQPAAVEVSAEKFNQVQVDDGSQVSLDLGERPVDHNSVEVQAPGINVRRAVLLEGSDDGQKWSKLAEKNLLRFLSDPDKLIDCTIKYSPSRYRYLRVTLRPDPQVDQRPVPIDKVIVRKPIQLPGEFVTYDAVVSPRDSVRTHAGPGSAWTIDLSADHVPCSRLTAQVADLEFVRNYRIESGGPPNSQSRFFQIAADNWHRRAGESKGDVLAEFSETATARLRLVIVDNRNRPLDITGIQIAAPARTVIVARSPELRGPLRLYYGNPKAEQPNYDFDRNLELPLKPPPVRLSLGERQENPLYEPEPLPLTERLPWLIYALLGFAVAVLGLLILSLARTTIALEDARQKSVPA